MMFEKRGAMPDRKSLALTLWLISSLALLASAEVLPVRMSGFVTDSSQPDRPGRDCFLLPDRPTTHLGAALTTDAVQQVNALPSESEEQDRADALDEPRVSFLIACSFRKVFDSQSIAPRSILSLYPLRC